MTEKEWLSCTDPQRMLKFLRGKVTDRKLRLFLCACARENRHLLTDDCCWQSVEVAERYVDGLASSAELATACRAACCTARTINDRFIQECNSFPPSLTERIRLDMLDDPEVAAYYGKMNGVLAAWLVAKATSEEVNDEWTASTSNSPVPTVNQCRFLWDIFFVLPFRTLTYSQSWLAWNGWSIPQFAQAIYDDRAFDRMPILADALEDAGCGNAEILDHCRKPGEHARGCWVVDLLIGKE